MRVFILRGYGIAFNNLKDAQDTIKTTWGNKDSFKIEGKDHCFVIRHLDGSGFTTVNIDAVDLLDRSTHL